ncbi:MAG: hypothetical protein PHE58_04500 [Candidatus Omnitrophica bacterium]|nr:hypothetical protein [Candidatus Omnitrophota bacterium]
MTGKGLFLSFICVFLCVHPCFSQGQVTQSEEWNPVSAGPLTTWTAPVCEKGQLIVQPFFFYNHTRGTFNDEGDYSSLPEGDKKSSFAEQFFFQYGLTNKLEFAGQTIYQQNYIEQSGEKARARGMGDSYLYLRYCLLSEQKILPLITGVFQVKAPSGKYQHAADDKLGTDIMGSGAWEHGYGVIVTKKIKPFVLHADALYSFPVSVTIDTVKTLYANNFTYDFGVEYFLPRGFNLLCEINGFMQGDRKDAGDRVPATDTGYVMVAPGIGWSNDKIQTLLCYQRVLAGTNCDANDSVAVTFVYTF